MKLTVPGATEKTGLQLVEQALGAGHEVTAFVRDPAKLSLLHDRLRVIQGDIADAQKVRKAVRGQDAVISAVGRTRTSAKDVLTVAAQHLVPAMLEAAPTRSSAATSRTSC